jgi:putative ABC transport system substrate-binding protein
VPKAKTLGLIYCSSEVNSQIQAQMAKTAAKAKGLNVLETTVSNVNDIQQAAQNLVGKADVIYVPTDNVLASAMPTLTAITNEAKIPVICGEGGMLKGGGLATLAVDYYKLGFTTGEMAADILAGKSKPADMAIKAQDKFDTIINKAEAQKLGIKLPADLEKFAK